MTGCHNNTPTQFNLSTIKKGSRFILLALLTINCYLSRKKFAYELVRQPSAGTCTTGKILTRIVSRFLVWINFVYATNCPGICLKSSSAQPADRKMDRSVNACELDASCYGWVKLGSNSVTIRLLF